MSGEILLRAEGVGKRFGGFVALNGIDLEVRAGERLGLIGPNGSGKSTFVNCLGGSFPAHEGRFIFDGKPMAGLAPHRRGHLGLARTFQLPRPFNSLSVLENVTVPLLFGPARETSPAEARARAMACLEQVELAGRAAQHPRELTQVDLRRLEIARAIALRPRLLVADEAMAGLSHTEVAQMLELLFRLNAAGTTIIMIEHVMRAVREFSQRLVVFVAGNKIADGDPNEVLAMQDVEEAYLGR
ncbi:amino acid/amide ABC transporter ATP-binding protein 1 (HAAT family) [Humitalea rosea]|uniref:Amino acid/amide ABC transporter ATP-binding protein 1 (HAAT family) n=1 Tax=Humitalea rosea TaxID=990373 RepID=A0A2W7HXZ2_9PROT|nr:ABC transporter ATP-binding protein [Humitalea rosea]PZW39344.1 amino acid/amide ABC transporter ATP-binding protein 1 (HAAT family) [Humitalea rosea]